MIFLQLPIRYGYGYGCDCGEYCLCLLSYYIFSKAMMRVNIPDIFPWSCDIVCCNIMIMLLCCVSNENNCFLPMKIQLMCFV